MTPAKRLAALRLKSSTLTKIDGNPPNKHHKNQGERKDMSRWTPNSLKNKTLKTLCVAALCLLPALAAPAQTTVKVVNPNAVVIKPTGSYYQHPFHTCDSVRVSAGYAYMKDQPSLNSKTYRLAPRGELLKLVKGANGYGYMKSGWWLVQSARNRRYWAHQSVVTCSK